MTLPLPDPSVSKRVGEPLLGEDVSHRVSPWGVQRNFETLAQRFPLGPEDLHFGGTVTALPTGVDEGFEVNYIADSTNGVVWRFKYLPTTSGTYPWLFIGGSPLAHYVDTDQNKAGGGAGYADLTTAGPTVTVPLNGDYEYAVSVNGYTAAAATMTFGLNIAGAAPAAPHLGQIRQDAATQGGTACFDQRLTGLTASNVLKVQYGANAVGQNFRWRTLKVRPIRVA